MMTSSEGVELPSIGDENQPGPALRRLMSMASSATLSATSAVSSGTIIHSPAVMAGQHWPEFHNGVAAGLMISPHTSVISYLWISVTVIPEYYILLLYNGNMRTVSL